MAVEFLLELPGYPEDTLGLAPKPLMVEALHMAVIPQCSGPGTYIS